MNKSITAQVELVFNVTVTIPFVAGYEDGAADDAIYAAATDAIYAGDAEPINWDIIDMEG